MLGSLFKSSRADRLQPIAKVEHTLQPLVVACGHGQQPGCSATELVGKAQSAATELVSVMVGFGQEIERAKNQTPAHRLHFLDYEGLKKVLEEVAKGEQLGVLLQQLGTQTLASKPASNAHSNRFLNMLEGEISKVNDFVVAKMGTLSSSFEMVLQQAKRPSANAKMLREEAARLEYELVTLDKFIRANVVGFRKVCCRGVTPP